jgi:hypothetical protein
MLIAAIMTLYQVVTYEQCFGYNSYFFSVSLMRWFCCLELLFHFWSFYFMRLSVFQCSAWLNVRLQLQLSASVSDLMEGIKPPPFTKIYY